MRFTAAEIAAATGGTVVGPDVVCDSVSIDTRTIEQGALFVPIVAERDGHDFVSGALDADAGAYLTERTPQGGTAVVVADTTVALADLGRAARRRHAGPVIGITGSVGKTSVKDLAAAAIGATLRVHASERSFNNELGVPLTLCNAPPDAQVLIVEMGARGPGHIRELCEIASPTVGIVTWVGAVHTSEFGNVEAVAQAKRELVEALPAEGVAVLNGESEPVLAMAEHTAASVRIYGIAGATDGVWATDVTLDVDLLPRFVLHAAGHALPVSLSVHGVHQVSNALAAVTAALAVGLSPEQAIGGLASATLSPWRMELHRPSSGAVVINDAYNANAISTAAALRSLAALSATRRVAILGVMAELGDRHDADHRAVAALAAELGIEVIAYREPAYGVGRVEDFDAALARLGELGPGDAVLVKGSRVAELERLAARLNGDV